MGRTALLTAELDTLKKGKSCEGPDFFPATDDTSLEAIPGNRHGLPTDPPRSGSSQDNPLHELPESLRDPSSGSLDRSPAIQDVHPVRGGGKTRPTEVSVPTKEGEITAAGAPGIRQHCSAEC